MSVSAHRVVFCIRDTMHTPYVGRNLQAQAAGLGGGRLRMSMTILDYIHYLLTTSEWAILVVNEARFVLFQGMYHPMIKFLTKK